MDLTSLFDFWVFVKITPIVVLVYLQCNEVSIFNLNVCDQHVICVFPPFRLWTKWSFFAKFGPYPARENTKPRVFKLPAVCTPSRNMEDAKMYDRGVTPVPQYGSWNDVRQQIFEQSASFVKVIVLYYVKITLLHEIVLIGFRL